MNDTKTMRMIELARAHVERGEANAAEVYYRMVLKDTDPPRSGVPRLSRGEACTWFARKALHNGRHGEAIDWYQLAVLADPLAVEIRVEYCRRALVPMGCMKSARIEAERATRIDPMHKPAWSTLGFIEQSMGNAAAAVVAYDHQLVLDPDDPNSRLDRATVAIDTADYETASAMCRPLLQGERAGDACHAMAMIAYRNGEHEEAIKLYDQAIAAGCYDPSLARWNQSLALHSIGRYREGWKAHEHRGLQKTDAGMALIMNRFTAPRWSGEPAMSGTHSGDVLNMKRASIHVHQEMGHGDTIAMARYLPLLVERGFDVRLEVADSMVGLMASSFPKVKVMSRAIDFPGAMGIPPFDYHVPMLSLPFLFDTEVDNVPSFPSYLVARAVDVERWSGRLGRVRGRRFGLCWSSGIRTDGLWMEQYGRRKSMPFGVLWSGLRAFSGLGDSFYSLQVGPERIERFGSEVLDVLPEAPSWADTAALIANLDIVITVDTSVAHLAGAMGKPVWVMMHTEGSWHWMAPRQGAKWNERSPWYPSARVYRQDRPNEWGGVVERIAGDVGATEDRAAV